MKNDYWNIKISTLDILKLDVYQSLIWKSLYPDMGKKLLQTTYTTENNFREISFQISNLQCIHIKKILHMYKNKPALPVSIF